MKKITQISLAKPGVNLEIFYESCGAKQALWLPLGAQEDLSQGCLLVYQTSSLMLLQVRRVQTGIPWRTKWKLWPRLAFHIEDESFIYGALKLHVHTSKKEAGEEDNVVKGPLTESG